MPVRPWSPSLRSLLLGVLGVGPLLWAWQSRAAASPDLTVQRDTGAESCPAADELSRAVAELVGSPPTLASTRFVITFTHTETTWHAVVVARGSVEGEREFDDPSVSCEHLGAAVALALAVLLDPDGTSATPAAGVSLVTSSTPAPVRSAPAREAQRPASAPTAHVAPVSSAHLRLDAQAGVGPGLAPGVPLALIAGGAYGPHDALELGLQGLWAGPGTSDRVPPGQAEIYLAGALARGCGVWGQSVRLHACAGFAAGAMHGRGSGYPAEGRPPATLAWYASELGVGLSGRLAGAWEWSARASALVALRENRFVVLGADQMAWTSPRLAAILTIGLRWRIW